MILKNLEGAVIVRTGARVIKHTHQPLLSSEVIRYEARDNSYAGVYFKCLEVTDQMAYLAPWPGAHGYEDIQAFVLEFYDDDKWEAVPDFICKLGIEYAKKESVGDKDD